MDGYPTKSETFGIAYRAYTSSFKWFTHVVYKLLRTWLVQFYYYTLLFFDGVTNIFVIWTCHFAHTSTDALGKLFPAVLLVEVNLYCGLITGMFLFLSIGIDNDKNIVFDGMIPVLSVVDDIDDAPKMIFSHQSKT